MYMLLCDIIDLIIYYYCESNHIKIGSYIVCVQRHSPNTNEMINDKWYGIVYA